MSHETEKGFGSGLRAQLEAKRAEAPPSEPVEAVETVEDTFDEPEPLAVDVADDEEIELPQRPDPELENVRAELQVSLRREQDLEAVPGENLGR